MKTKVCHTCKLLLSLRNFTSNKNRELGCSDDCRKCRSINKTSTNK